MSVQKTNRYEMDMCNGPILKKILIFTLPLMASSLLQLLFNAADVVIVGRFCGDNALAAVGSNGPMINLLTNFFIGLSVGANVLVARYFAAKEQEALSDTIHTAMFLAIVSGIALTFVGILGARQFLIWMQSPGEVIDLATLYLRIYFLGMPAMMVYNFGAAILRAVGDTKRPLYFLLLAGVINVALNLLFVVGLRMSVAGVALATIISQYLSAALIVRCMITNEGSVRLVLSKLHLDLGVFGWILRIGLPASVQGMIFSISNVIIQASVNSFGEIVVAGNSAASNIEGFVYVAMNAFHQTAVSFTSQNLGAGKINRINRILICSQLCVVVVGLTLGNLVVFYGAPLVGLYSDSPEVVACGVARLAVISRTYALCGLMDVMVGSLRGLGYSIQPMIVSIVGVCGVRLLWIFTLFRQEAFHTVESLYWTYPVSWIIAIVAHVVCFIVVRRRLDKRVIG